MLVQPSIPPAEVLAFPASLQHHVSLGLHLEGPAWAALKQRVLAAAGGRCAVTGAPLAAVHERWAFDDASRVLRLAGLRAAAPEVQQVGPSAPWSLQATAWHRRECSGGASCFARSMACLC